MSRRVQRLNMLFREELSELIRVHLRDPRLPEIVSITRVETAADLQHATVHVSVLGDDEAKARTIETLTGAAALLRRRLSDRVPIRRTPALHFVLDESIEQAAHILEIMKRVSEEKEP